MVDKEDIVKKLASFGLDSREAEVYIALLAKKNLTALMLSRETGINRTTLYRILEKLVKIGLVKEMVDYKSTSFTANPADHLKSLLFKKEAEMSDMRENLDTIVNSLDKIPQESGGQTRVFYYKGQSGLQQLLWNTLLANDGVVGLGYMDWNKSVGKKYAEKIRAEYVERKIDNKELLNEGRLDVKQNFTGNKEYLTKYYAHRIISQKVLPINYDTYIYNDVFAFYYYFDNEVFGVEIHNAEIAFSQRRIFEILWNMAKADKF